MEVTSKTKGEAIVIYLNGELTTTNSPEAQTEINEVLESAKCKLVVINVENVDFIASTGLRIILALGKLRTNRFSRWRDFPDYSTSLTPKKRHCN
jgi:anti-anti-sigma factor